MVFQIRLGGTFEPLLNTDCDLEEFDGKFVLVIKKAQKILLGTKK